MARTVVISLALSVMVLLASPVAAQDGEPFEPFSPDQLDNLLAPIALYPDPLLAQVLLAATFPDQIDDAARFVRFDANPEDVDAQPWDVSVKAVAHYPQVVEMMADKLDWTTALGQAYVNQSTDVMASVQRLRAQALQAGNLASTPEMQVVESGGEIELWPAQPEYIFVPQYDPAVVFFARAPLFFGVRFLIGAWLNVDLDWRTHRVFYHGWEHGPLWAERSRPFIHVNNVYINNTYRTVIVNRNVVRQPVNYRALNRYDEVHRKANFDSFRGPARVVYNAPPPPPVPPPVSQPIRNKIIMRNVNTNDPRLEQFRGHVAKAPPGPHVPDVPAFTPSHGGFEPRQEGRRGQASRAQARPPSPPPPHPAPSRVERKRK